MEPDGGAAVGHSREAVGRPFREPEHRRIQGIADRPACDHREVSQDQKAGDHEQESQGNPATAADAPQRPHGGEAGSPPHGKLGEHDRDADHERHDQVGDDERGPPPSAAW